MMLINRTFIYSDVIFISYLLILLLSLVFSIKDMRRKSRFDRSKLQKTNIKLLDSSTIKSYECNPKTCSEDGIRIACKDFLENHN